MMSIHIQSEITQFFDDENFVNQIQYGVNQLMASEDVDVLPIETEYGTMYAVKLPNREIVEVFMDL